MQSKDRALLAALSRYLPRAHWSVFLVKPETLLGWHRRMVRRQWTLSGPWVAQQARNLLLNLGDRATAFRFLIRDRDTKFTRAFDDVWRSTGGQIVSTPAQAPNANAVAERWVGTVRRACLDHLLIVGRQHLVHVLRGYVEHYNQHRPHRSLDLARPYRRCVVTQRVR
jgi:putative transposase